MINASSETLRFSPALGIVAIALLPCIALAGGLVVEMARGNFQPDIFALAVAYAATTVVVFGRYQLSFESTALHYRRWGKTITAIYSDIDSITLVTNRWGKPVRGIVHMKNGEELPIWWKLFPPRAGERFLMSAPINEATRAMR